MNSIVFHVDVNSAFLSWEAAYRVNVLGEKQDLRDIPSAIGGDISKRHGIILAKSIPSKKYGIQTGEPVTQALNKCPQLVLALPNYELYNQCSQATMKLLSEYTDTLEQYSVDEAFMVMTGCTKDPVKTAYEIKGRIRDELGFTVNIGVSENHLLAKMASDFTKPDKVHTLWRSEMKEKMWPLPVQDLFFIGRATGNKLRSLGVNTIGELAAMNPQILKSHFKSQGQLIHNLANGIDDGLFEWTEGPNKGYGNSLTTPRDVTSMEAARPYLLELSETVSARLRADNVKVSSITMGIRDCDLKWSSHQMQLKNATDLTGEIFDAACICLKEMWDGYPLRQLSVRTSKVDTEATRQLNLFDTVDYDKQKKVENAVDELRERIGSDIITRASLLDKKTRWER